MKRSTDRILTTHVGSLIRPPALREFLAAKEAGKPKPVMGGPGGRPGGPGGPGGPRQGGGFGGGGGGGGFSRGPR